MISPWGLAFWGGGNEFLREMLQGLGLCSSAQKTEGEARLGEREADNLVTEGLVAATYCVHDFALWACIPGKGKRIST